jgi:SAM-dependent methyltransferase
MVVSTHHHSISGDPLTHQRALAQLTEAGAHIITEHSVAESFSGDGLIVASFDDRDRDLVVEVSRARAKDSLFGEPEVELDTPRGRAGAGAGSEPGGNPHVERLRATVARWRQGPELEAAVLWGYRYLLDREPESKEVVRGHAAEAGTWQEVRATIVSSAEYAAKQSSRPSISGFEPAMELELTDDPETTAALLDHIAATWTSLGELDPHYSVVTNEDFRRDSFGAHEDEFFASGEGDVRRFLSTVARNGLPLPRNGCWLELGCGVGRVTPFLAAEAGSLIAMDISAAHLELARERVLATGRGNVELRLLTRVEDLDGLPELDVFFSVIVLQHNPPPVIRAMLDRTFARIAPGGVAYFQVPTYREGYRFDLDDYLSTTAMLNEMEMHVLPQREIIRCAAARGLELVEALEDTCTGMRPGEISNTFLFHKPEG